MRFWLGVHKPRWVWDERFRDVPLFVSHRRMRETVTLRPAVTDWALDSGGFTELGRHGSWQTTQREYVAGARRCRDEVGRLAWIAPQDWMCEPQMLARTGLSVGQHQLNTVRSFLSLRWEAPDLPTIPVVQGHTLDEYLRCVDLYSELGVDLEAEPLVGIGSVCRRQHTEEIGAIVTALAPLRLHGFGVKTQGIDRYGPLLASSDSMAWSLDARRSAPMPGHTHSACQNCPEYALAWRERLLAKVLRGEPEPIPF